MVEKARSYGCRNVGFIYSSSAKDTLDLYKSRDQSEKLFKGDKFYLANRSVRKAELHDGTGCP